jgi:hypothetical protein
MLRDIGTETISPATLHRPVQLDHMAAGRRRQRHRHHYEHVLAAGIRRTDMTTRPLCHPGAVEPQFCRPTQPAVPMSQHCDRLSGSCRLRRDQPRTGHRRRRRTGRRDTTRRRRRRRRTYGGRARAAHGISRQQHHAGAHHDQARLDEPAQPAQEHHRPSNPFRRPAVRPPRLSRLLPPEHDDVRLPLGVVGIRVVSHAVHGPPRRTSITSGMTPQKSQRTPSESG